MKRRTELAMERIAQEEARALQEVRSRAADLAIRTTRRLLDRARSAPARRRRLIRGAIEEVKRKLA